jgi:hypothetical protein
LATRCGSDVRAIADAAQVIVNSAKFEVEILRVTSGVRGSGFIVDGDRKPPLGLIGGGILPFSASPSRRK